MKKINQNRLTSNFYHFSNCPTLAKTNCYDYKQHCPKSCGLCEGMTPAPTVECPDRHFDCPERAKTKCWKHGQMCKRSCGNCPGMTPHKPNTKPKNIDHCFKNWPLCDSLKNFCGMALIYSACPGTCCANPPVTPPEETCVKSCSN